VREQLLDAKIAARVAALLDWPEAPSTAEELPPLCRGVSVRMDARLR
jgi:hypothetical protein